MRFLHLADLHIGKRIYGMDLFEDQKHILDQILERIGELKPDAVFLSGDIYDRAQPSSRSINMLNDFISGISESGTPLFMISGNHDNPSQISYLGGVLEKNGIMVSMPFDGKLQKHVLEDGFGKVNIYMLPFIRPIHARQFYGENIVTYEDAVRAVIENSCVDERERNVLLLHQYVAGAVRCESEDPISVGTLDEIGTGVFDSFDYVALGHIHTPQSFEGNRISYPGSMMKYSFDEAGQIKGMILGELKEKGELDTKRIPLKPLRDVRTEKGTFRELLNRAGSDDYIEAQLEDEQAQIDAMGTLRIRFPNLLHLRYLNIQGRDEAFVPEGTDIEDKSDLELFTEFFRMQNGDVPMNDRERGYFLQILQEMEDRG